jgi:hypothetical protein
MLGQHQGKLTASPSGSVEELTRNSADESVPWLIQKYGGTSVGKSLDSITKIVEYVLGGIQLTLDHIYPILESHWSAQPGHLIQKHWELPTSSYKHPGKPSSLLLDLRPHLVHKHPISPNESVLDSSIPLERGKCQIA